MGSDPAAIKGVQVDERSWTVQRRVLGALLLRELLTRYGRNNIGFLWLFVEPIIFTVIVVGIWTALRPIHGSDIPIAAFAISGYSSMFLWRNPSNRCIDAAKNNASLLYHRQVTVLDVFTARIGLEQMAATTSVVVLGIAAYIFGLAPLPQDIILSLAGWGLLAWFGAALGMTIGGLAEKFDFVGKLWPAFSYILFPFSGIAFLATALPEPARNIALWVPMLNNLEMMRDGWFGNTFTAYYSFGYGVIANLLLTFVGIALVRQIGIDSRAA